MVSHAAVRIDLIRRLSGCISVVGPTRSTGGPHPRGAWPLEESLFATHIEPAEHGPLALGGIEISLLPSPFGLPPGIRTTAMQTVELCDLGARVDGFVGRPRPRCPLQRRHCRAVTIDYSKQGSVG